MHLGLSLSHAKLSVVLCSKHIEYLSEHKNIFYLNIPWIFPQYPMCTFLDQFGGFGHCYSVTKCLLRHSQQSCLIKNPQSVICRSQEWHSLDASAQPCKKQPDPLQVSVIHPNQPRSGATNNSQSSHLFSSSTPVVFVYFMSSLYGQCRK